MSMSLNLRSGVFFFPRLPNKKGRRTPDRRSYFTNYLKLEKSDLINESKLTGHFRQGLRLLMPQNF